MRTTDITSHSRAAEALMNHEENTRFRINDAVGYEPYVEARREAIREFYYLLSVSELPKWVGSQNLKINLHFQ